MSMQRTLATLPLHRSLATRDEQVMLQAGALTASLFRYASGIEALRLRNTRGSLVLLPWYGQIIWQAEFDGVPLAMQSGFSMPLPSSGIAGTYGCLAFHSGLLRNGVPGPEDDHAAHGEFPTATLGDAWLELGEDAHGLTLRLGGEHEHVVGFGPHYLARPFVALGERATLFEIGMHIENRSGKPMELMYMAHVNFAFVPHGRIIQPVPFTPAHVQVRRAVPAHVQPNPDYLAFIETLARSPERMRQLDEPARYDPEQVFYLKALPRGPDGRTAIMLRRPQGDGFALSHAPAQFPHCVRWILDDPDQKVAAFSLPSTCEPEGYAAERRKGNVRLLAPGAEAGFSLTAGYLDRAAADRMATHIEQLSSDRKQA
ncbi:aldose 1-epimerase family protein [Lichenicoccus sp.]|uniref:aldose 1-epimerase family protein n=1 Tax=Lichenicoccus sp. TaxID=2781899 RepID=UPI003D0A3C4F